MDSRIQNLENHLLPHPPSSPPHSTYDPSDPKGKRPMGSLLPTSPIPIINRSSSSSSSSSSSHIAAQFELAAREPISPTPNIPHPSSNSEATPSPPAPIPTPPKEPYPVTSSPQSPPPNKFLNHLHLIPLLKYHLHHPHHLKKHLQPPYLNFLHLIL